MTKAAKEYLAGIMIGLLILLPIVLLFMSNHAPRLSPAWYINNTVSTCTPTSGGGDVCYHKLEPAAGR